MSDIDPAAITDPTRQLCVEGTIPSSRTWRAVERALLADCSGAGCQVRDLVAHENLEIEAARRLEVENFPVIVSNDCHGGAPNQDARQAFVRERWKRRTADG